MFQWRSGRIVGSCLVILFAVALLLGAGGDGGCIRSAADLCTESGGTMVEATNWPTFCGDDPSTPGLAVKAGEQACACPADKPFWRSGYGCENCASRCIGHAEFCEFIYIEAFCHDQVGCTWDDDDEECEGFEQKCWTFDNATACNRQDGCSWK